MVGERGKKLRVREKIAYKYVRVWQSCSQLST